MADKYATIQQHPNMRTPGDWQQMKSFVVQLEEILDDIYRRFGRLRFEDLGDKLQNRFEDAEGNISELVVDVNGISGRVSTAEGDISRIDQKADSINLAVGKKARTFSQASQPTSTSDYTLVAGDLWIDTDDGNKAYRYNGSSWVEISDANKYSVQSGIAITSAGVTITGDKLVSIQSGGKFEVDSTNFKINSVNETVKIGKWQFYNGGLNYNDTGAAQGAVKSFSIGTGAGQASISLQNKGSSDTVGITFSEWMITPNSASGVTSLGHSSYKWNYVYANYFSGQLASSSSREVKDNIRKIQDAGEQIDRLEPVTFTYKDDPDRKTRMGLIYEDTVDVVPEICIDGEDGKAINYVELVPMLLREIQSLRKRVAELEGKVYV